MDLVVGSLKELVIEKFWTFEIPNLNLKFQMAILVACRRNVLKTNFSKSLPFTVGLLTGVSIELHTRVHTDRVAP